MNYALGGTPLLDDEYFIKRKKSKVHPPNDIQNTSLHMLYGKFKQFKV